MSSILQQNEMRLDLFTPTKPGSVAGGQRNGPGMQYLPSGISIRGFWRDNQLEGETVIRFPDSKTEVRGLVENNRLVSGLIRFDSGAKVEGEFSFNGSHDVFKTVMITFTNRYYLKAEFNEAGQITKGVLYSHKCHEVARYKGEPFVHEAEPGRGIIVDGSFIFEGEIANGEMGERGFQYLSIGLVYYEMQQSQQARTIKEQVYYGHNQYQSRTEFRNDNLVRSTRLFSNGVAETIDMNVEPQCVIRFDKIGVEGFIETLHADYRLPKTTKGTFVLKTLRVPIQYEMDKLAFAVHYQGKVYDVAAFCDMLQNKIDAPKIPETVIETKKPSKPKEEPKAKEDIKPKEDGKTKEDIKPKEELTKTRESIKLKEEPAKAKEEVRPKEEAKHKEETKHKEEPKHKEDWKPKFEIKFKDDRKGKESLKLKDSHKPKDDPKFRESLKLKDSQGLKDDFKSKQDGKKDVDDREDISPLKKTTVSQFVSTTSKQPDSDSTATMPIKLSDDHDSSRLLELTEQNQQLRASVTEVRTELSYLRKLLCTKEEIIKDYQAYAKNPNYLLDESVAFFKGSIKEGVKHGQCEELLQDGYFTGFYVDGQRHGDGVLVTSKFTYVGDFTNNKIEGTGTKTYLDTAKVLSGPFVDGQFAGKQLTLNHMRFEGEIIEDKMNGLGALEFSNGYVFQGKFVNDEIMEQFEGTLEDRNSQTSFKVKLRQLTEVKMSLLETAQGQMFQVDMAGGRIIRLK